MNPQRIQRKRTKGFRLPDDAICISRPSIFGNYAATVGRDGITQAEAAELYGYWLQFKATAEFRALVRSALAGKDLACWCKAGTPCHGDYLLSLANSKPNP